MFSSPSLSLMILKSVHRVAGVVMNVKSGNVLLSKLLVSFKGEGTLQCTRFGLPSHNACLCVLFEMVISGELR